MRPPLSLALLTAFVLAGCSGGGSGSSTPAAPNSGPLSTQDVAQAGTEAALSPADAGDSDAGYYDASFGTKSLARAAAVSAAPGPVCANRREVIVTAPGANERQVEVKFFYDAACTVLARDVVQLTTTNADGSKTATRTSTEYNAAGSTIASRKSTYSYTGSLGNSSAVATSALFIGTSTSPLTQWGRQVTLAPQGASVSTLSENGAWIVNDGLPKVNESFGHQGQVAGGTATFDAAGDVTYAGTRNRTFFKGPLNSLTLSEAPPFQIGGTPAPVQIGTSTMKGSLTFDSDGLLTSIALNGTFLGGNSVLVTSSGTPLVVSGTIKTPAGATAATFTTDAFGNGTILFANGTQLPIICWHVI
jgi:hypothetical protein